MHFDILQEQWNIRNNLDLQGNSVNGLLKIKSCSTQQTQKYLSFPI